jgi:putative NADH-flavin reductase
VKVLVFGAGGKTGRAVVEQALAGGHQVTAFLHHGGDFDIPGVTAREGDAADPDAVQRAVEGQDAVIDTIGGKTPYKDTDLESTAAATIVAAMRQAGVRRLLATSMIGEGDSTANTPIYTRILASTYLRGAKSDKAAMESTVESSGLDWVIVRPAILNDGPANGNVRVFDPATGEKAHSISRQDVAAFLVDQLTRDEYLGRSVMIATK